MNKNIPRFFDQSQSILERHVLMAEERLGEPLEVIVALRDIGSQGGGRGLDVGAEEDWAGARGELAAEHGGVERPGSQPDSGNVVTKMK